LRRAILIRSGMKLRWSAEIEAAASGCSLSQEKLAVQHVGSEDVVGKPIDHEVKKLRGEAFFPGFIVPDKFENCAVDFFVLDAMCVEAGEVELRHEGLFREEVRAGAGDEFDERGVEDGIGSSRGQEFVQLIDELEEVLVLLVEDGDADRVFPLPCVVTQS
jgi:hypothetical protein